MADPLRGEEQYDLILPIVVTAPDRIPQPHLLAEPPLWPFDTCYSYFAITSDEFLDEQYNLTLAPEADEIETVQDDFSLPHNRYIQLTTDGVGESGWLPNYQADLWLVGNQAGFRGVPIRLNSRTGGLLVQTGRVRTLLGRRAMIGTGLRMIIHLDGTPTVSIWVPDELLERNRKLLENH